MAMEVEDVDDDGGPEAEEEQEDEEAEDEEGDDEDEEEERGEVEKKLLVSESFHHIGPVSVQPPATIAGSSAISTTSPVPLTASTLHYLDLPTAMTNGAPYGYADTDSPDCGYYDQDCTEPICAVPTQPLSAPTVGVTGRRSPSCDGSTMVGSWRSFLLANWVVATLP